MKWSSYFNKTRRALALGAVLAASVGATMPAKAQTVEEIKKKGQLTVGMLVDFPPFGITNLEGQPDGFDADIAKQVAFSDPYAGIRIVVYGKKSAAVKEPADLKNVSVGVARASTQDVSLTAIA